VARRHRPDAQLTVAVNEQLAAIKTSLRPATAEWVAVEGVHLIQIAKLNLNMCGALPKKISPAHPPHRRKINTHLTQTGSPRPVDDSGKSENGGLSGSSTSLDMQKTAQKW